MKISKKPFLGIVLIALNFNILAQVGIGTSNPHASAALEIQSTSKGFLFPRMTEVARNAISNIATGLTIYCTDCSTSGGGVLQVYNASNWEDLNDFVSASTGGMFTEKVGIGTIGTTPSYALDVDANNKGSSTYSARFTNSAPDNDLYNIVRFTQGASGTAEGYLGTGASNVLNDAFKNNFVVGTKSNSPLVLNTNDTEKMRIDTIGRVGIGTTPLFALHIDAKDKGSSSHTAKFENSKTDDNIYNTLLFTQGASDTATGYLGTGGSTVNNSSFKNNFVVGTQNNTPLVLNTNDTERMRIDALGNVGIGTSDPTQTLDVNGSIRSRTMGFKLADETTTAGLLIMHKDITGSGTDRSPVLFAETGNQLSFMTNGRAEERMVIDLSGNVGIGTPNPKSKLHISGGSADWNETIQGLSIGSIHLDPENWTNNFGNAITFGASDYSSGENAQAGIYVRSDGSYGTKMYFSTSNSYTEGSKTAMSIDHNGKVGIGTTNPNHKLEVIGTIKANILKSNAYTWSDFVFESEYKLPTLRDVENHIKEKGHLKDIPSASEVQKNGINLGEMDAKLLQKVEELTLYTIDQQKEIEELKKQNSKIDKQQNEIDELKALVQKLLKDKN